MSPAPRAAALGCLGLWLAAGAAGAQDAAPSAPPRPRVDFVLHVRAPAAGHACDPPGETVRLTLEGLQADARLTPRVAWVGSDARADVRLCKRGNRLWFLDGAAGLKPQRAEGSSLDLRYSDAPPTAGSSLTPFAASLIETLERIARVENLLRVGAALPPLDTGLSVDIAACGHAQFNRCGNTAVTDSTVLHAGDGLRVHLTNQAAQPVDVTVLRIDATDTLTALFPEPETGSARSRIAPGAKPLEVTFTLAAGTERLLVIAVPSDARTSAANFTTLAQAGPAPSPHDGSTPLAQLLEAAVYGSHLRSRPLEPGLAAALVAYAWPVTP